MDRLVVRIIVLLANFYLISCDYNVGVGIADCTGPSVEIVFMGYAKSNQKGCGIHLRQFSRAYIIDDGDSRVAFITVDAAMMHTGIKRSVLKNLVKLYNDTYKDDNVILSGTHTHGTPGGFLQDLMYDIPDFGFCHETFEALVSGITQSIINAHNNISPAKIFVNSDELLEANINRSPASYLLNSEEERSKYKYDVDKEITQVTFRRKSDNSLMGAVHWFAVHGTSMNNTNCLVSSDNVGLASILLEQKYNAGTLPGKGSFVGAFASTNLGDVSPNTKGAFCTNTGERCEMVSSTCNGSAKYCIGRGPGNDMFESTHIIATKLYEKALDLLDQDSVEVTGPIKYLHQYVYMPNQTANVTFANGTTSQVRGCLPAMGYSFAAGTTDGPGEFNFSQATVTTNPFWNAVRNLVFPPTPDEIACHAPKPILINTGRISVPYEWQPRIVATQLVLVGSLALAAVPGEFTTMSGRRLRHTVKEALVKNGASQDVKVIITGLSNVYSSYIATPEEYQLQRYEGASTIFGPHTLTIYLKLYKELAQAIMEGKVVDNGPIPPDFSDKLLSLILPVVYDSSGLRQFGDCILQPATKAVVGDTVTAKFVAGNPRNNVMQGNTFLLVERLNGTDNWIPVASDANWETKFIWKRTSTLLGLSEATVQWRIGNEVIPGSYRIKHFGYHKSLFGGSVKPYEGVTNAFRVQGSSLNVLLRRK